MSVLFKKCTLFIYLAVSGLKRSHVGSSALHVACRIFSSSKQTLSRGMWDLVPWREWIQATCTGNSVLVTRPPGKSLSTPSLSKHFLSLCYKPSSKDTEMDRVLAISPISKPQHSLPQPLTRSLSPAHHLSHFLWLQPPPGMACHFCLPVWLQSSYDSRFLSLWGLAFSRKEMLKQEFPPMILFCKIRLYCFTPISVLVLEVLMFL